MPHDEIIEEVWRAREEYGARFDFDLRAIARDLREKAEREGLVLVKLPARSIEEATPPALGEEVGMGDSRLPVHSITPLDSTLPTR